MMFAQTNALTILNQIQGLFNFIIPMLITLAVIYFIYGVVRYVITADSDKKSEARDIIIRGVIGLFIIISVWGVVFMIQRTLLVGTGQIDRSNIPSVNF